MSWNCLQSNWRIYLYLWAVWYVVVNVECDRQWINMLAFWTTESNYISVLYAVIKIIPNIWFVWFLLAEGHVAVEKGWDSDADSSHEHNRKVWVHHMGMSYSCFGSYRERRHYSIYKKFLPSCRKSFVCKFRYHTPSSECYKCTPLLKYTVWNTLCYRTVHVFIVWSFPLPYL